MKIKFLLFFFCYSLFLNAQKIDFNKSALTITKGLTENANTVTRFSNTNVKIVSEKEMEVTYHFFITVLNELGGKSPFFIESYDKHSTISKVKIKVYNILGEVIKKVKGKEISDIASNEDSLFSDNRLKYYEYVTNKYPYSIEVSYKVKTSNTAFIPRWHVYDSYYNAIENNTFTIHYPSDLILNYKESNFKGYPIQKQVEDNAISYKVANIKAIKYESLAPIYANIAPTVSFALNKFSLAGVKGEATSWKNYGKWMYDKILNGRNQLSENTKKEIKKLVQHKENPIERAKLVYDYMQNKTRYISVQVGIGGWKPMKATDVDKLGYGDCKALVNYTQALLSEANVKSEYTIVYSGEKKNIKKDLVSTQGNHIILMLPTKKDTIWLECTSQKLPFGQTGDTDDRDVLVIYPEGGKLVHTNTYTEDKNLQKIKGKYTINKKGDIDAAIEINSTGKQYNNRYGLDFEKKEDQITYYKKMFSGILDVQISDVTLINDKKKVVFTEKISLKANNYAELLGEEIMLKLNAFNMYSNLPKREISRKFPLVIKQGFTDKDEIEISLPENYTIDKLPEKIEIENQFGKYQATLRKIKDNKLIYNRLLVLKQAKYPNTAYNKYRKFIKEIIKNDNLKIIIKRR